MRTFAFLFTPVMSKRKKIILWLIGAVVLITILRETGRVHLNWYSSSINSEVTAAITDHVVTTEMPRHLMRDSVITSACNYPDMAAVPVCVCVGDCMVGDTAFTPCSQIWVDYNEDINYGFLYTPLYKAGDFLVDVPVYGSAILYTPHDSMITVRNISFSGTVNVEGHYSMTGVISGYTTRELIRRYIAEQVYAQVTARTAAMGL